MKRIFFQSVVVSIRLYGCTTWKLTKRMEKKLDGNYTRMLRAILNKSWRQHPTKQQLYGHVPLITKTIKVRRTRLAGHCWRSRDELISDILQWTPSHRRVKTGRPARTYKQQLSVDTGCSPEDLLEAMNDREGWRERVKDIHADGMTWWWWWWCIPFVSIVKLYSLARFSGDRFTVVYKIVFFISSLWSFFFFLVDILLLVVVGGRSRGRPEGSLFNIYYTKMLGRALLLSLDCSIIPLISNLYCFSNVTVRATWLSRRRFDSSRVIPGLLLESIWCKTRNRRGKQCITDDLPWCI